MHSLARLVILSALTLTTSAHFVLQTPPSLGFDEDTLEQSPCGGSAITFNSSDASVQVGGFAAGMLSTHPAAQWMFRATTDMQAPFNWTNLLPVVQETGLGEFCLPALTTPDNFAGKQGLVQVIQDGPDGTLYQVSLPMCRADAINLTLFLVRGSQLCHRRQHYSACRLQKRNRPDSNLDRFRQLRLLLISFIIDVDGITDRFGDRFCRIIELNWQRWSHECASSSTRSDRRCRCRCAAIALDRPKSGCDAPLIAQQVRRTYSSRCS
jgi:hypothetical protein